MTKDEFLDELFLESSPMRNEEEFPMSESMRKWRLQKPEMAAVPSFHGDRYVAIPDLVYFIECSGYVKIGVSHNPESRLATMQLASPFDMKIVRVIPGKRCVEKSFHERFAAHRHRNEWFRIEGALKEWLEKEAAE